MSFELSAAALTPSTAAAPGAASGGSMQVGYNASLTDLNAFNQSMTEAGMRLEARGVEPTSQAAQQLMKPFEHINNEAKQISTEAANARGKELSPSEMVSLTVRSQEFMFHCTLTSNIANRTADGLSQLFRQQS